MKETALHFFICALTVIWSFAVSTPPVFAQSQALNGQIEGTVLDQTGAAVSSATITATNIETGANRSVITDENGVFRFPLLPLGSYRIAAEAANFKKLVREGISLAAGQTATVNLNLEAGEVQEIVTVSSDTSVADAGKTYLGRVLNNREVQNLPLIQRNPYNFGLLQANANGRINRGLGVLNIKVNGYQGRIYYLLDGSTNQQGDLGAWRLMILSDTQVNEIQVVTNGFAPEFGNTPGMIMNFVTPSGTNKTSGTLSYRFRRPKFYSRPFFFPAADLPESRVDNLTGSVGGAIWRDRWHYFFGYEYLKRDDNSIAERVLTIRPEDRALLIATGLRPEIFPPAIPSTETHHFYIFRTDAQLKERHRLTARFNYHDGFVKNFIPGGFNTLERGTSTSPMDYGLAMQFASFTPQVLNEFRFQHATRADNLSCRNEYSGTGPSVSIPEVANFGSPVCGNRGLIRVTQFQDNLTLSSGAHVFKFGSGFNYYDNLARGSISSIYTFRRIDDYVAARTGTNPRSYIRYEETFGDPVIGYRATYWNFFAQDDWKITRRLKINYGLRYDLYLIPQADQGAPLTFSQKFNVDKNNFAPRLGVVYASREETRPTILRFGAGFYYDQPLLQMYVRALRNNGNPKFFSLSFSPTGANDAPDFPNRFAGSPILTARQNIDAIAPDFVNMYAMHLNFQIEQALTENLSLAASYVHSGGRHIPVYRNINCLPVGGALADGRLLLGTINAAGAIMPCTNRLFPQFQNIQMVESAGVSRYDAFVLQLTKRFSRGLQFSTHYTLSKATDDAPEQNMTTQSIQGLVLSDPSNRALDKSYSIADQRHTFVMSLIARPQFNFSNKRLRYLFNHNQFGVIASANSGETFNIICNCDLNRDGISTSDRPVGVKRNAGKTPPQYNADLRYSRFLNLTERYRVEVFGEFQNLFNINSIVQYNDVRVPTDIQTGALIGELPDFKAPVFQESRQFQLGFKFIF
jgi:hypothetical protein